MLVLLQTVLYTWHSEVISASCRLAGRHTGCVALYAAGIRVSIYIQQCLSQHLETGRPEWAIVKMHPISLGRPQYSQITTINVYLPNEIKHNIHILCHGNYIEVEKIDYMLEIDILRNYSKIFGCPEGRFFRVCVSKRHPWRHPAG